MEPRKELQKFLEDRGGLNPFGGPLYRLVWSNDRLCWRHGEWNDNDEHGILIRTVVEARQVPKYAFLKNRWIVEAWRPAESYGTPEEWQREMTEWKRGVTCSILGEYPSRGDYELLDAVEIVGQCECGKEVKKPCPTCKKQTNYLEPSESYLESVLGLAARAKTRTRMDAGIRARDLDEKTRQKMTDLYYHRLKDEMRAFHGAKHVAGFSGLVTPNDVSSSGLILP